MSVFDVRQQVVSNLVLHLNGTVKADAIKSHRGQFESLDEIKTIAARSLSTLVAIRSVDQIKKDYEKYTGNALFIVYVPAASSRNNNAGERAGMVSESIAQLIADKAKQWSFAEEEPDSIRFVDVTTLAIERTGVALWEVSWRQKMQFGAVDLSTVGIFEGYDADHYAEGDDVAIDNTLAQSHQDYPE